MRAPPNPRIGLAGATIASILLHGLIYFLVMTFGTVPDLDFEFEMPTEIEFGMTDELEAAGGGFDAPPPPEQVAAETTDGEGGEGAAADAGPPKPDAGPPDAGVPDAGPLVAEAETDEEGAGAEEGEDESTLPAGAQIAIRIDMARVRASALNEDVRRLMAAIPDWQLLLEGSGLDPLDDLDRLLIASPNLQRSRLVLAGRHSHPDGGTDYIREVVAHFAEARGVDAPWSEQEGVPVAPWPNEDQTERVIAIVGPRHFVIARPEDLGTILAIAVAREEADDDEQVEEARGADALLSMGEEEALSIEVEGARNFVRGRMEHIPERIRIAVSEDANHAVLGGRARYEDESTAEAAYEYWEERRERYSRTLLVGGYVRDLELAADGRFVSIDHRLSIGQARLLLSFLQGAVQRPRNRRRPTPSRTGSAMDSAMGPSASPSMR